MASTHMEPQLLLTSTQITVAIILAVIFGVNKQTRKPNWFLLPAVLVAFAFVYPIIVGQFDCCPGM